MSKSGGHAGPATEERHRQTGPDVVTAGAPVGEGGGARVPSVRERLQSRDLAVKVFVAGATYVALSWINKVWAVVGAVLSPVVSDLIRDYVERRQWSLGRLRRGAAATVLLGHEEDAYAARRRTRAGWQRRVPTSLVAGAATVTLVVGAVALVGFPGHSRHDRRHDGGGQASYRIPAQVVGVHGATPTTEAPVIEWQAVRGAHRYIVFRNGARVGVRTGLRFVDRTATFGVLTYTVAAEARGHVGPRSNAKTIVFQTVTAPLAGLVLVGRTHTTQPPAFRWQPMPAADMYVVYRDGSRIAEIPGTGYQDRVGPGTYTYRVSWIHSGIESRLSGPLTIVYAATGVTVPTGLRSTGPPSAPPALAWDEVKDAAGYVVYRGGVRHEAVTTNSYVDRSAGAGTYAYQVSAIVGATESVRSTPPVVVEYAPLPEKPLLSGGSSSTNAPPRFKWGPVRYTKSFAIYRNGTMIATTPNHAFADPAALPDGSYEYRVSGINARGDEGPRSDPLVIVVDTTPPATPLGLVFTSHGTVGPPTMAWHASAGAVEYIVLRAGRTSVSWPSTRYSDADAPVGVLSRYQVEAVDAAGNVSAPTAAIEIVRTG